MRQLQKDEILKDIKGYKSELTLENMRLRAVIEEQKATLLTVSKDNIEQESQIKKLSGVCKDLLQSNLLTVINNFRISMFESSFKK